METVTIELIAEQQAQIDELRHRLIETLEKLEDMSSAAWEVATSLEYVVEETARDGKMKARLLDKLSGAIETIEDVMGVRHDE